MLYFNNNIISYEKGLMLIDNIVLLYDYIVSSPKSRCNSKRQNIDY